MTELNTIWKDKSITLQLKIKLVKCLTWTVMTYSTEGWTLKAKQIKKIQSAEMWFYRRMLRVSWIEKRTDESILKELCMKRELVNFIKKRKLSFIGHACRSKCSLMKDRQTFSTIVSHALGSKSSLYFSCPMLYCLSYLAPDKKEKFKISTQRLQH